jgi:hypothetical protein
MHAVIGDIQRVLDVLGLLRSDSRIGPKLLANELEMLECTAAQRRPESRLSCQIEMTAALDGIVVHVPERQQ